MDDNIVAAIDDMLRKTTSADDALIRLAKKYEASTASIDAMRKTVNSADEFLSQPSIDGIIRRDARAAIERLVAAVAGAAYGQQLKPVDKEALERVVKVANHAVSVLGSLIKP